MKHRPWPYTKRLVARMADSSLQDDSVSIRRRAARSAGLHASELLKILYPHDEDRPDAITPEQLRVYGLFGLAFEDRCETALLSLSNEADWPYYAFRSSELHYHDVACSPDIILASKEDDSFRELSIKMTWKSCKGLPFHKEGCGGFPTKFNYYFDQVLTYAEPLDTTEAVILIGFVCGDYKGNKHPQIHGWDLSFTGRERMEMWQTLDNLKRKRTQWTDTGTIHRTHRWTISRLRRSFRYFDSSCWNTPRCRSFRLRSCPTGSITSSA